MKIFLLILINLLFWLPPTFNLVRPENKNLRNKSNKYEDTFEKDVLDIYAKCNLKDELDYRIFRRAVFGYDSLKLMNKRVLSIIDFSKPSTEKRLFIIDIENRMLLFQTFVAHGRNSGLILPTKFSNRIGSNQSSLGFYRTAETYKGKNGYSLMLDGLQININDNARKRAIVIHGAKYVSDEFIKQNNRLGRSYGCPAVSEELSSEIIDLIKDGSCLYIYAKNPDFEEKRVETKLNEQMLTNRN